MDSGWRLHFLDPFATCMLLFSRPVVSDSLQPHGLQYTRPLCLSLLLWRVMIPTWTQARELNFSPDSQTAAFVHGVCEHVNIPACTLLSAKVDAHIG